MHAAPTTERIIDAAAAAAAAAERIVETTTEAATNAGRIMETTIDPASTTKGIAGAIESMAHISSKRVAGDIQAKISADHRQTVCGIDRGDVVKSVREAGTTHPM